jgi:hypothetical protein
VVRRIDPKRLHPHPARGVKRHVQLERAAVAVPETAVRTLASSAAELTCTRFTQVKPMIICASGCGMLSDSAPPTRRYPLIGRRISLGRRIRLAAEFDIHDA